jgi:hypothetical protein
MSTKKSTGKSKKVHPSDCLCRECIKPQKRKADPLADPDPLAPAVESEADKKPKSTKDSLAKKHAHEAKINSEIPNLRDCARFHRDLLIVASKDHRTKDNASRLDIQPPMSFFDIVSFHEETLSEYASLGLDIPKSTQKYTMSLALISATFD